MATQETTNTILNGQPAGAAKMTTTLRIWAGRVALLAALVALLGGAALTDGAFDPEAAVQAVDTAVSATVAGGERLANDARTFYLLVGGKKLVPTTAERLPATVLKSMKTKLCKETEVALKATPRRVRS